MEPHDTYKYQVKIGGEVVHIGITKDLNRRARQHKLEFPNSHIVKIGNKTTFKAASQWERGILNRFKIDPEELLTLSDDTRSKLLQRTDGILKILDKRL